MAFSEIINELNYRIRESDSILNDLQPSRSKKRGLSRVSKKFLGNRQDILNLGYTFHHGGGDEFQFNIGAESEFEGKPIFRFGLAFNFQASQSVPDPIAVQQKPIQRFNKFIRKYPKYLSEESFWIWDSFERTTSSKVGKIRSSDVKLGNFLFLGKLLPKTTTEISDKDLEEILNELEYLYPLYQYVQLEFETAVKLDKIARICFNTEGWTKPSGPKGKSKTKDTHEFNYGFGLEEWLLDFSKLINGFHYAFLEPIHRFRAKYIGEVFNIHLYTIDSTSRQQFWIGKLESVEVIDYSDSNYIINKYKKMGWYKEMGDHLSELNLGPSKLEIWANDNTLFNIRFRPENFHSLDTAVLVDKEDKAIPSTRYNLLNLTVLPKEIETVEEDIFKPGEENYPNPKFVTTSTRVSVPKLIQIPHIHYRITESLVKLLKIQGFKVEYERPIGYGSKIDIVGWKGKQATFFEIKTYPSAKACIREALGQILEYSLYPASYRAEKLVIVSQNKSSKSDQDYIENLRKTLSLNLEYWCFDLEKKNISEKIK